MMKNKLYSLLLTFFSVLSLYAQGGTPPVPGDGGGGTTGTGTASAPIDMYVYLLLIVAMIFIVYFSKKSIKKAF